MKSENKKDNTKINKIELNKETKPKVKLDKTPNVKSALKKTKSKESQINSSLEIANDQICNKDNLLINDLKSKIEILNQQLIWYKSLFEYSSDAIFIVQVDTWCLLETNDIASTLLEIPKEKLIGSIFPQFKKLNELLNTTSSPIVLSELNLNLNHKPNLNLFTSASFVEIQGQKLIQILARDSSAQNRLNDKLVLADKLALLGMLSSGVTHEIRNPLAAVHLNLQLLNRQIDENSPLFPFLEAALLGTERISKIVEVSLNFSSITMPVIKKMNVNSLFPPTLDLIAPTIRKKEIKVDVKLDDNLPLISIDEKQIQQVLINLIKNAFDAIKEKGNIQISTYQEYSTIPTNDNYVIISIADDGCGIADENKAKIFNPFFSLKADGIGLGLAIAQKIMLQHNGTIELSSKINEGTKIIVKLPIPKN